MKNNNIFINYINILEGIKTRTKNLHWAADKLNISSKHTAHELLDDLYKLISDHQDTIAETSQGILGNYIEMCSISGVKICVNTINELMKILLKETSNFYNKISDNIAYVGIKSDIESFLSGLSKLNYLFSLCE